jgi:hypothetical protein
MGDVMVLQDIINKHLDTSYMPCIHMLNKSMEGGLMMWMSTKIKEIYMKENECRTKGCSDELIKWGPLHGGHFDKFPWQQC